MKDHAISPSQARALLHSLLSDGDRRYLTAKTLKAKHGLDPCDIMHEAFYNAAGELETGGGRAQLVHFVDETELRKLAGFTSWSAYMDYRKAQQQAVERGG